jgi:hypothetical protein
VLEVRAGQVAELYIQANPFKLERMSGNAGLPGQ